MLRQSPLKLNSTNTHRKVLKEVNAKPMKDKVTKKEVNKYNTKVLELLKVRLRRVDDKSKSKSRRFWYLMHLHKIVIYHFIIYAMRNSLYRFFNDPKKLKIHCLVILSCFMHCKRMISNILDDNYNIQM